MKRLFNIFASCFLFITTFLFFFYYNTAYSAAFKIGLPPTDSYISRESDLPDSNCLDKIFHRQFVPAIRIRNTSQYTSCILPSVCAVGIFLCILINGVVFRRNYRNRQGTSAAGKRAPPLLSDIQPKFINF